MQGDRIAQRNLAVDAGAQVGGLALALLGEKLEETWSVRLAPVALSRGAGMGASMVF